MEKQLAELDSDISIKGRKISKRIQKCLKIAKIKGTSKLHKKGTREFSVT